MPKQRVEIRITDDGMTALATVTWGEPAGAEQVQAALERAGVTHGLDVAACEQLAENLGDGEFCAEALALAHGRAPVPSRGAGFEPLFHVGIQPGHVRPDGTMDFFDRELLKPAREGDLLGHMRPARPGSPGLRVDGRSPPVPHVPGVSPRLGPSVAVDAHGRITASRAGTIVYRPPELLDVVEHYVHEGDVGIRSGHLTTEGSLVIRGDVKHTFGVRALGDLEIHGLVESGSVYAGGNIRVHGGVGGGDGIVSACGDLTAPRAERTTLISGGTLTLDDSLHCTLTAKRIQVRGALRGGHATAELSIRAGQVGAPNAKAETVLTVGLPIDPPELAATPVIVQTIVEIAPLPHRESERPLSALSTVILASRPPGRGSEIPRRSSLAPAGASTFPPCTSSGHAPSASTAPGRSVKPQATSHADAAHAAAEQATARAAHAQSLLGMASIEVHGTAHAGITVQIGEARLVLDGPMQQVRFSLDVATGKIQTSNLQP